MVKPGMPYLYHLTVKETFKRPTFAYSSGEYSMLKGAIEKNGYQKSYERKLIFARQEPIASLLRCIRNS